MGRPKRSRPTQRVNYKLDSDIRDMLKRQAVRKRTNEGSHIEDIVLMTEAIDRLIARSEEINMTQIKKEVDIIWGEITSND